MPNTASSSGDGAGPSRCLNFKFIRGLLMKLNDELLATTVPSWGWISMDADIANRKRLVDNLMCTRFRDGMDSNDVAKLELALLQHKRINRQWKGLQMVDFPGKRRTNVDPAALVEKLRKCVCSFVPLLATHTTLKDQVWIRLDMAAAREAEDAPNGSDVIVIIHFPHAKYLVTSKVPRKHSTVLYQALGRVFECREIRELDISGKDVDALGEMLLNQHSQGKFSEYRLQQVDVDPLDRKRKKPRLIDEHIPKAPHDPLDKHIVKDDADVEVAIVKESLEKFGPNPLPALDRIEFKMSTPFTWDDVHLPQFGCTVRFEGSDVLTGIKRLPHSGLAGTLPPFLTEIPSSAQNRFEITTSAEDVPDKDND